MAGAADHAAPPVPVGHPAQLQLRLHVRAGLGARQFGRRRGRPRPRGGPGAAMFGSGNLLGLGTSARIPGRVSGRVARGVLADDEEALPHQLLAHLGRHGGLEGALSLGAKSPVEIALMRSGNVMTYELRIHVQDFEGKSYTRKNTKIGIELKVHAQKSK